MFFQFHNGRSQGPGGPTLGSLLFHAAVLAWILHSPAPRFIAPSSIVRGVHGGVVTQLYWPASPSGNRPSLTPPNSTRSSAAVSPSRQKLVWRKAEGRSPEVISQSTSREAGQSGPGNQVSAPLPAGSAYGSLSHGSSIGEEIRPALWASGGDPVIEAAELSPGVEGNVVVEITIDERGNVVRTLVLQSLGPAIDTKVVAALENWRFRPATRDGLPIPSKQDVYYHFPLRR